MDDDLHRHLVEMGRHHWWYRGRRRVIRSVLTHRVALHDDATILEVGAGTGSVTGLLSEFGDVVALEPNGIALKACAEVAPRATLIQGGVDDLVQHDVGDDAYDIIAAFDVIEHLPDDSAALQALRDHLRPGGALVLTVPALDLLWGPHDEVNGHFRRYNRAQLRRLIKRSGFTPTYLSYFNTFLLPAVAAVRVGRRLRPGPPPPPGSDFVLPGHAVNNLLTEILGGEARILERRSLPLGSSLIAVATRS